MNNTIDHTVNIETPVRMDKLIAGLQNEALYSRSFIESLITSGLIFINGNPCLKKSTLLHNGDHLQINLPQIELSTPFEAEDIPVNIFYEDDDLAIIEKPAGLTVHPAPGHRNGTLVNALQHHFNKELSTGYSEERPGIVHRLDKDTSGLMIIAKNDKTQTKLSCMFQNHEIEKYYRAIVCGVPIETEGSIETFISRHSKDKTKMSVSSTGRNAITKFKLIESYSFFSLLDVQILTGRTHQIRVHLAHIKHPIFGDPLYSSQQQALSYLPDNYKKRVKFLLQNLHRQALHAYRLRFMHPTKQIMIDYQVDLPTDMDYTVLKLKEYFGQIGEK